MTTLTLAHATARNLSLDHAQLLVIANRPGTRIKVLSGSVWMTQQGQPDDRIAAAGEELLVTQGGRTVIEGFGRARLQLVVPARRWAEWLPAWPAALRPEPGNLTARALTLSLSLVMSIGLVELLARG